MLATVVLGFWRIEPMITIGKPSIFEFDGKVRIQNTIDVDGHREALWFDVEPEYAEYLCPERSDAYVIGLLHYAMSHQHDITCEVPMGEELHYQISEYLIPSLAKHSKVLYPTKIFTALDSTVMQNAGAVGTGMSCGIDSLHVLANQTDNVPPALRVTHIAHFNVGAHSISEFRLMDNAGVHKTELRYNQHEANVVRFANDAGLKVVLTNSNFKNRSNFAKLIQQGHHYMHTYASCFAIYMLQKLWNVYYYASSGADFSEFTIVNSEKNASGLHDLLSLACFSTKSLKIYSEGGAKSRLEKTKQVITYPLAKKYLNVCNFHVHNCGRCGKCRRTLLSLDALNSLEEFRAVFDIDYYNSHRNSYYIWLCHKRMRNHPFAKGPDDAYAKELYEVLSPRINLYHRLVGCLITCVFFIGLCFEKIPILSKMPFLPKLLRKWEDQYRNPLLRQCCEHPQSVSATEVASQNRDSMPDDTDRR
jgi:hypothetical protein